jgi:galactokinase
MIEELRARFEEGYGRRPRLFRAPGRVNIIGEHTDYNDGFALPAAIDLAIVVAAAPRADRRVRARSLALDAAIEFDLDAPPAPSGDWGDYIRGVASMLRREGCEIGGADLMIAGDLPMGAGLSASAALEIAIAVALTNLARRAIDKVELAKLCQRAENEFVGARCGVMDQYASCCGVAGHALLLDCRTLRAEPIAIAPSARLVVCDSMVRHRIAGGEYNQRRRECEQAVALLAPRVPGVAALRDVTLDALARNAEALPDVLYRRARHVIGENARTLRAAAALKDGDLSECGRLMNLSHESLRDDYEVSCPELDSLVAIARGLPGVHGARMMGGGFGGCVIALVDASAAEPIVATIRAAYGEALGGTPSVFCCAPAQGAGPVEF